MTADVAVPLPDGRWLLLDKEQFAEALKRGAELVVPTAGQGATPAAEERLVNSKELAALVGVHDTTLEHYAKQRAIPSVRIGRSLRFRPSEVIAALKERK